MSRDLAYCISDDNQPINNVGNTAQNINDKLALIRKSIEAQN